MRALVTGAAGGLGRAVALRLAADGAQLGLLARRELDEVAFACRQAGARDVHVALADATDVEATAEAAGRLGRSLGGLDSIVLNAAPWHEGPLDGSDVLTQSEVITAGVGGTLAVCVAVVPLAAGGATFVLVGSTAALPRNVHPRASVAFHAMKHGQVGLADALRAEVASRRIRVCALHPPDFEDPVPVAERIVAALGDGFAEEIVLGPQ